MFVNNKMSTQEPDEIYVEVNKFAKESISSASRALRLIELTREIGSGTMTKLKDQGRKITHMQGDMDTVHNNMKQSERKIRAIESIGGTVANSVTHSSNEPSKTRAKQDVQLMKTRCKEDTKLKRSNEIPRGRNLMIEVDSSKPFGTNEEDFYRTVDNTEHILDKIGAALDDLKNIAIDMGSELNEQNDRLTNLDKEVSSAQPRLDKAVRRTRALVHS